MNGLTRIQRYIFAEMARALGLVMGVIVLAILLVDSVEQINTVGTRAEVSWFDALTFSLMKLPSLIEQTLAFGLLIASMLTFRSLSKRAELPVFRASGVSAWNFLTPCILLALIVGLFTMMAISPVGSQLTQQYDGLRAELLQQNSAQIANGETGIWLRDGDELAQMIIHAESIDRSGTVLSDARFIEQERILNTDTNDAFTFLRRIDADKATLQSGFWQLDNVIEYRPDTTSQTFERLSFSTDMERATLIDRFRSPTHIGFWHLPDYIEASETVGINATKFKMRYQGLLALPAMFIAMSLIGALACLRLVRLGRTAPLIMIGSGSAILLYFANQLGSSFGSSGDVPAIIAAWSPPVFVIFVCLALVAYFEDG